MPINRSDATAITVQIANDLRRRIADGEFAADQRMPSLRALAAEYEVAELTAHSAVKTLQAEGLLVASPGRGTYVRPPGEAGEESADLEEQVAALQVDVASILQRLDRIEQSQGESTS